MSSVKVIHFNQNFNFSCCIVREKARERERERESQKEREKETEGERQSVILIGIQSNSIQSNNKTTQYQVFSLQNQPN